MAEKKDNKRVVFRRIGGRIVPIAVSVGGGAAAFDAARTRRVYASKKIVIDRKKFAIQKYAWTTPGDKLIARHSKTGQMVGEARYYVDKGEGGFSWLVVKRRFRKQGLSQPIARAAAVEMRAKGAKTLSSHVIHPGSLLSKFDRKRDSVWVEYAGRKKGDLPTLYKTTRTDAIKRVTRWQKQYRANMWNSRWSDFIDGKSGFKDLLMGKKQKWARAIHRETKLPNTLRRPFKPFMTAGNKWKLGLGLTAFIGGGAYAASTWGDE